MGEEVGVGETARILGVVPVDDKAKGGNVLLSSRRENQDRALGRLVDVIAPHLAVAQVV